MDSYQTDTDISLSLPIPIIDIGIGYTDLADYHSKPNPHQQYQNQKLKKKVSLSQQRCCETPAAARVEANENDINARNEAAEKETEVNKNTHSQVVEKLTVEAAFKVVDEVCNADALESENVNPTEDEHKVSDI